MPRKLLVGGTNRNHKTLSPKKVSPPTVPQLCSPKKYIYNDTLENDSCNIIDFCSLPPKSPSNGIIHPSVMNHNVNIHSPKRKPFPVVISCVPERIHVTQAEVHAHFESGSLPSTPLGSCDSSISTAVHNSVTQLSLEDQGIDVSPGRESPGGSSGASTSSGSRYSTSSLDSGRASNSGNDVKVLQRRLSIQSYESGSSPQRNSYHSSNSSLHSEEDVVPHFKVPNVAEMMLHGLQDEEILINWLTSLHFENYVHYFLQAGYDMPTISRMTPEDLTAIGITKPNHRRKLKAEIAKLNISDGIPNYKPNSLLEWLQLLRLEEYYHALCEQGYNTVDRVTELAWEDLEDIGIQKLGHQKKVMLAIKRVQDINSGRRPNVFPEVRQAVTVTRDFPATLPRPSTLTTIPAYQYPVQDISIATVKPKNSPSTDSIPELKTFQQVQSKENNYRSDLILSPKKNPVFQTNGTAILVQSPTRGRSLESLTSEPPLTSLSSSTLQSHDLGRDWKTTDLDGESQCGGTATLNRPRGLLCPRPVPKISGKETDIIDDKEVIGLVKDRPLDGWASLEGSPRHGTLKKPPPPPPKRLNSTKAEPTPIEDKKVDSALPVTSAPVTVNGIQNSVQNEEPAVVPPKQPPSIPERQKKPPVPERTAPIDELFNNPLFQQRRKDSTESTSSTESSALPFANENIGTIKQKVAKPYPSLLADSFKEHSGSEGGNRKLRNSNSSEDGEYDVTPEMMSPGDVIDDIENMLANLSDQLDAMLEDEQIPQQNSH